jgi:hypothetical protein
VKLLRRSVPPPRRTTAKPFLRLRFNLLREGDPRSGKPRKRIHDIPATRLLAYPQAGNDGAGIARRAGPWTLGNCSFDPVGILNIDANDPQLIRRDHGAAEPATISTLFSLIGG